MSVLWLLTFSGVSVVSGVIGAIAAFKMPCSIAIFCVTFCLQFLVYKLKGEV